MILIIDWVTIIISSFLFGNPIKKLKRAVGYIIYYIFFIYYVLPLYLDCIISPMSYFQRSNIKFATYQNDASTRIVFDLVILIIQIIILFVCKKNEGDNNSNWYDNLPSVKIEKGNVNIILIIGMISAIIATIITPMDNRILFYYQWRESYTPRSNTGLYGSIEKLTYISATCSIILIFSEVKKNLSRKIFTISFSLVCLFMSLCIEGKRSITFFSLIVFFMIFIYDYVASKKANAGKKSKYDLLKMFSIILVSILIMGIFFNLSVYVNLNRGRDFSTISNVYTSLRIELFRDDRVRMAIYSLLYPDRLKIIDYPFQTLFVGFLNIFPLDIILGKQGYSLYEYTDYISVSLGGWDIRNIGIMMTPAILAEFISNLHFFGVPVFLIMTAWFINLTERNSYPYNIFLLLSFLLIQIYSTTYTMYFLQFSFTMLALKKYEKREIVFTVNGKRI